MEAYNQERRVFGEWRNAEEHLQDWQKSPPQNFRHGQIFGERFMDNIKFLSVRQPFALAIVSGVKPIENKTQNSNHRGTLVIHTGRNDSYLKDYCREDTELKKYLDAFALGAAIGVVEMTDAGALSPKFEPFPFAYGPVCYRFENPRIFAKPIPFSGQVGILRVPKKVEDEIRTQIATAVVRIDFPDPWLKAIQGEEYELCYRQGVTYYEMEKYKQALTRFDAALKLKPDYVWAFHDRAITHLMAGDYDAALADIHRAINLEPKNAVLCRSKAKMLEMMSDEGHQVKYEEAIIALGHAIEMVDCDNVAQYYFERARIFEKTGEKHKADEDFERAKKADPELYREMLNALESDESSN